MSLAKKLKMIIKGEPKPTFGTDPNDPWSVRAGITESETSMLGSYLKSRGINPEFVSKDTKISHAKSTEFSKWKRDHNFDDPADYVSSTTRDKMKAQREEVQFDEAKTIQGTALDKFRQAAAERARKHDDIEREMKARHAAGKEDMKGSIDRLEKQLNKEESGEFMKNVKRKVAAAKADKYTHYSKTSKDMPNTSDTYAQMAKHQKKLSQEESGVSKTKETAFHKKLDKLVHGTFGKRKDEMKEEIDITEKNDSHTHAAHYEDPKTGEWTGMNLLIAKDDEDAIRQANEKCKEGCRLTKVERHITVKEEVEQIDEISKSTLDSYKDKSSTSLKNAKMNRDAAEPGKNMSKAFADLHAKSNAIAKKRVKGLMGYLQRKQGVKPMGEDVYQDTQAATQTAFDMGTAADQTEPIYSRKKEMSKSARMIKSLYKKHKMVKEELYDHEKEDKSVATYGKKPKVEKVEADGDENNQAAMVLKGGKTLTGQTRDTLEIDPVMRKPGSPDDKTSNKKTDK
jgi:hypothetical protein